MGIKTSVWSSLFLRAMGIGQSYCHGIYLLWLPIAISISITNHLKFSGLKQLFYYIDRFWGSGLWAGNIGATLPGASVGEVWRAGDDSNGWDLKSSGSFFTHRSTIWAWLGLSTGVPVSGLSQWLGFPFNMAASGWADFFHSGSWLQEQVEAARWKMHGFGWPGVGSHMAALLPYFISWGGRELMRIQGEGTRTPTLVAGT